MKRRIRARMARTGERYSTARRQVLRRLAGDQPDAPEEAQSTRRRRLRIGAVGLLLVVAVAGAVVIVATQRGEDPVDKGPSATRSENRHAGIAAADPCRELSFGPVRARHLDLDRVYTMIRIWPQGLRPIAAVTRREIVNCMLSKLRRRPAALPRWSSRLLADEQVRAALRERIQGLLRPLPRAG